jgi:hypothetical protein
MRVLMLASLALNLLLLASMVAARVDSSSPRDAGSGSAEPDWAEIAAQSKEGGLDADAGANAEAVAGALTAAGIPAADVRAMLAGWAEGEARRARTSPGPDFWAPGFDPAVATLERELAIEADVRATLLALVGPGVVDDPAFARFFRPLGPEFDFLTPADQLRLREHQLERARSQGNSMHAHSAAGQSCLRLSSAPADVPPPGAADALADLLDPAAYEEYLLRFSPAARRLRALAAVPDEAAFRDANGVLRELERAHEPGLQLSLRRRLREVLGRDAYLAFWSEQDPVFEPVARYLASQGFGDAEVHEAYGILNRTQEALLELMAREADQPTLLNAVVRLRDDEAARLERLLGEASARGLDAVSTRAAMQLQTGSRETCAPGD